jgi:RNA-directed DNA polymerase
MEGGVASARTEGTPHGGPLSPLWSNILRTALDRELERRGHCFCRYADDGNLYVGSERNGQRVLPAITAFLERRRKLKVNAEKSAVARPWPRKFLGYRRTWHREAKRKIAEPSRARFVEKVRPALRAGRGRSLKRWGGRTAGVIPPPTRSLRSTHLAIAPLPRGSALNVATNP